MLGVEETTQFTLVVLDEFENVISAKPEWIVLAENGIGQVDSEGKFTAGTKVGTYEGALAAEVTQNGLTKRTTVDVTILPGPLHRLVLFPEHITLEMKQTQQLIAIPMYQFDNPIPGLSISYDSGNQAGSVNPSGMLTGGTKSGVYGSSGTARVTQGTITRSAQATVTLVGTEVQGIVASDQVWTVKNSPYLIVDTIQIPSGVTLTIEPDVEVRSTRSASGAMFLVHGELYAHGTSTRPILFEGTEASDFFSGKGSNAQSLVDLEYVAIRNGRSLWPATGHQQYGTFRLRNSQITHISGFSYIWYPDQDVHVEYNSFVDSAGFSIGHKGPSVYIRYNCFSNNRGFVVQNWASYDGKTEVRYNSFHRASGIILELPPGYDSAAMEASENYWGTNDAAAMIFDNKVDITSANSIEFQPILSKPHPDTPSCPSR